eukprot:TRINITY_DN65779_c0_g1_i1.p1 TRINITY_DN65779_c0_g1~~TRINITY_DN65779_c0_g1_i1.p1  ORF type:complete len:306 (-),score=73.16 TRINITY_DN65779_c0_g1_i1:95-1012(-)
MAKKKGATTTAASQPSTDGGDAKSDLKSNGEDRRERLPRKWRRSGELDDSRRKELERRNVEKYKFCKFIEQQKVEKKLKACRRKLEAALQAGKEDDAKALRVELRQHLDDAEYIEYFPRHLAYCALFPKVDSEASKARREQMRKIIREERSAVEAREKEAAALKGSVEASKPVKKKKVKSSKKDEHAEEADVAPEPTNDVPAKQKSKKRKALAQEPTEAPSGAPAVDTATKKKKKKARTSDGTAISVQKDAKQKSAAEPQTSKKKKLAAGDEAGEHPSWAAAKSSKVSGAIVSGEGERTVFSDSE